MIEPATGRLTGADTGKGRLPDPEEIFAVARAVLRRGSGAPAAADLAGRQVVVTAGGTREPLDPVRFLGNRSSGKQGYAFARTAVARGARGNADQRERVPAGAGGRRPSSAVGRTEELRKATLDASARADVVIMAAAPADFRPAEYAESRRSRRRGRHAPVLQLVTNPDIAAELGERKPPGRSSSRSPPRPVMPWRTPAPSSPQRKRT